ncbi:transglutaminase domain-containing protein [Marinigracilibium pacificum]|uniref:DUF3857 and transglutaminase domain-containing protein n=1 Tax=Marinigracilibium pacificum TaxID=2729599 RepID=A0A848ISE3_9BACT|nr:transglutaminase domain-containing protein [Marinigracilibium pacificum]NMM47267.1 DUF3857 and transglutaminase domain-containing protein [Marinigracilibium pacificum]
MRAFFSLLCLISIFTLSVSAQDRKFEFGEIEDKAILKSQEDPEFKEAKRVILYDIGMTNFVDLVDGYQIEFTRQKRVKVYTNDDNVDNIVRIICYKDGLGNKEIVRDIEVNTYNLDGNEISKVSITKDGLNVTELNNNWTETSFEIPSIKNGSVYEIKYTKEIPFPENLPSWEFQSKYPTRYSQYTAALVPFYSYVYYAQAINSFDIHNQEQTHSERQHGVAVDGLIYGMDVGEGLLFKDMIHTFGLKNVPAFNPDKYLSSPGDYIKKITFQLSKRQNPQGGWWDVMTTWPNLNEKLLKDDFFGKYIKKAEKEAGEIIENLNIEQGSNTKKKVQQIVNYVKDNYTTTYNSLYASKKPKETIDSKSGNSADINLLLLALFREADIISYPVIISTRDHGKINKDFPFEKNFNNVIIYVNELKILCDATDKNLPYDLISPESINEDGMVISEDTPLWISVKHNGLSTDKTKLELTPEVENNNINTSITKEYTLYKALEVKHEFENNNDKIKESLATKGLTNISNVETINYDKRGMSYIITSTAEGHLTKEKDIIKLKPFLNFPIQKNPFEAKDRNYPVDFIYPISYEYSTIINIPEGHEVGNIPDDFNLETDEAFIRVNYKKNDNSIEVIGQFTLKQGLYSDGVYLRLRRYFMIASVQLNKEIELIKSKPEDL